MRPNANRAKFGTVNFSHNVTSVLVAAQAGEARVTQTILEHRVRAIEARSNAYLTKPLRRAVLMEAISRCTDAASA